MNNIVLGKDKTKNDVLIYIHKRKHKKERRKTIKEKKHTQTNKVNKREVLKTNNSFTALII